MPTVIMPTPETTPSFLQKQMLMGSLQNNCSKQQLKRPGQSARVLQKDFTMDVLLLNNFQRQNKNLLRACAQSTPGRIFSCHLGYYFFYQMFPSQQQMNHRTGVITVKVCAAEDHVTQRVLGFKTSMHNFKILKQTFVNYK